MLDSQGIHMGAALTLSADDRNALLDLKARYFRFVDTQDWQALGALLTVDATLSPVDDLPGVTFDGAEAIMQGVSNSMRDVVSVHHGFTPEFAMTGADEASGIWPMEDHLWFGPNSAAPGLTLNGYGHYHERYQRIDGDWRFRSIELRRLRVETRTEAPSESGSI